MNKNLISRFRSILPGLLLCAAVTATSFGVEHLEPFFFGHAWLESLVLSILVGSAIRTAYDVHQRFEAGIHFGAKMMLEIAVVLLGGVRQRRRDFGKRPAVDRRYRTGSLDRDRRQLLHRPRQRLAEQNGNLDRMWQFDLRQFRHCRRGAGD